MELEDIMIETIINKMIDKFACDKTERRRMAKDLNGKSLTFLNAFNRVSDEDKTYILKATNRADRLDKIETAYGRWRYIYAIATRLMRQKFNV